MSPTPELSDSPATPSQQKAKRPITPVTPPTSTKKTSGGVLFPVQAKVRLVEAAMELAAKSLPFKELAQEVHFHRCVSREMC